LALWRAWRRPLLLPAFLLVIALTAAVLPPVASTIQADLTNLALYDDEPKIRALLTRAEPRTTLTLEGTVRVRDSITTRVLESGGALRWDGKVVTVGDATFTPPVRLAPPLRVPLKIEGRAYDGVATLTADGDTLLVVNRVALETYLAGVIAAEMGLHFPDEALKAQAIASRTYAVRRMRTRRSKDYDVGVTQSTQVYRGIPAADARATRIVSATRGIIMSWEGTILDALYSSTCGGATRPATEAFGDPAPAALDGVPCGHCNDSPRFLWTARTPRAALARALGLADARFTIADARFFRSGRLRDITVRGGGNTRIITGTRLRRALVEKAYSPWITAVTVEGKDVVVTGRGFGHGVGMCQYGARGLARRRRDVSAILARYYPGAEMALAW